MAIRTVDRWDGGFGWIAEPEETMQRASHALVDNGDVWIVDPVDTSGLDEQIAEKGEVTGVVVLCPFRSLSKGGVLVANKLERAFR